MNYENLNTRIADCYRQRQLEPYQYFPLAYLYNLYSLVHLAHWLYTHIHLPTKLLLRSCKASDASIIISDLVYSTIVRYAESTYLSDFLCK